MRGSTGGTNASSRFNMDYEAKSMYEGIAEDLGGTVGQQVDWFRWQDYYLTSNYESVIDDTYDTSSSISGQGRRWMLPFKLPTVMAQLIRSSNVMNERGFYVTDTLRIVVNVGDAQRLIPEMISNPSSHIKDRIVYLGEVYVPTRVLPRGSFGNRWAVVTIDCNQVNPEELINDPQFQNYAQPATPDNRNLVADLVGLKLDTGLSLVPTFNKDVLSYTLHVGAGASSLNLTPITSNELGSSVVIDNPNVSHASPTTLPLQTRSGVLANIELPTSSTTITVTAVAANTSPTKTYVITVTKENPQGYGLSGYASNPYGE